jgi:hypothetical protein
MKRWAEVVAVAVKERCEVPRKANKSTMDSQWELAAISAAVLVNTVSNVYGGC